MLFAIVLRGMNKKKSGNIYMGWFTITVMDMRATEGIEIIFKGLKEKVPENATIIDLINKHNEHENISR
jgi:hypothetical protein